jgi:hypothetical protein
MSGEVAVRDDSQLAAFLAAGKAAVVSDPQEAALEIVRRILAAPDAEAVLVQQEAIHARDVLNETLHVLGFDVNESDFTEGGPSFYMLVNCVDNDGVPYRVTCGAINVMAQLFRLGQLNAFPLDARIVESAKQTAAGYRPMWLEAVDPAF